MDSKINRDQQIYRQINYLKKATNNFHSQNLKEKNRIKNIYFIKQSFYYCNKMKS